MSAERITELSAADLTWLQRAEDHILALVRARYGIESFTRSEADFAVLQRLIDDQSVTRRDLLEGQCIGVVIGNVFEAKMGMAWKRVANEVGDMIALHDAASHFTYYPLTMISKRLDGGRSIDIAGLYADLAVTLSSNR